MSRVLAVVLATVTVLSMVTATAVAAPAAPSPSHPATSAEPSDAGTAQPHGTNDTASSAPRDARAGDTPVLTGVFRPTLDGQLYGHTGEAVPEGKSAEWADGYTAPVELAAAEGADVSGRVHVKTFSDRTFLGLTGEWAAALDGETVETVRIRIDPGESGSLDEGDVRLVLTVPDDAAEAGSTDDVLRLDTASVATYEDGEWVPVDLPDERASAVGDAVFACCSSDGGVGTLEAEIDTEALEEALGDRAENDTTGIDVEIETDSNSYDLAGDGDRFGVVGTQIDRSAWVDAVPDLEDLGIEIHDVGLDRVEITQAVQTRDNDLTLVAGKDTLARAFVTHDHDESVEMRVTFTAKRGVLTRSGGVRLVTIGSRSTTFDAPPGTPDRDDLSDSGNVELPDHWTTPRSVAGRSLPRRIEVTVEPVGDIDSSSGNDGGGETVRFVHTYDPNIYLVRVNEGPASNPELATQAEIDAMKDRFRETYPVADPNFVQIIPNLLGPESGQEDINLLGELDELEATFDAIGGPSSSLPKADALVGVTEDGRPNDDGTVTVGLATVAYPNGHSGGIASWSAPRPDTFVHEINHNIGNNTWGRHVTNSSAEASRGVLYGCDAGGPDGLWQQRFDDGLTHEVGWEPGSGLEDARSDDFMTYCNDEWISDYRWEMLVDRFVGFTPGETVHPDLQSGSGSSGSSGEASTTEVRVVSGRLSADGTGELDPSFRIPGNATGRERDVENPQALVVVEYADDTVTRPVRVNAPAEDTLGGTAQTRDDGPVEASFTVSIPAREGIERIRLLDAEGEEREVLDERVATDFAVESAEIDVPGEVTRDELTDVGIDLETDADTELYKRLWYVPNGGEFTKPVEGDFREPLETGYLVPYGKTFTGGTRTASFDGLPGGEARFLLLVSDGVETEAVASKTFVVPPGSPSVQVDRNQRVTVVEGEAQPGTVPPSQPVEGIENAASPIQVRSGETVAATATAKDQFGRSLAGRETSAGAPALEWNLLDAGGDVVATDTGRTVEIRGPNADGGTADSLAPGSYELRVTGTDPTSGRTATDAVGVEVAAPPLPDTRTIAAFERAIEDRTGPSGPTVRLEAAESTIRPEGTIAVDVVVTGIERGVGSYNLTVESSDASRARIVGAEPRIGGSGDAIPAEDGASVRVGAFAGDTSDTGPVRIAAVTVAGVEPGEATLSVSVASLSDEAGDRYDLAATEATTIAVEEEIRGPEVIAGRPARDLDGDGTYEDVNGDGDLTPGDATVLFRAAFEGNPAVADNPEQFDLNRDGDLTPGDATALFERSFGR